MVNQSEFEKIESFFTSHSKITIRKKDMLITAGQEPEFMYFLEKGTIRMFGTSAAGDILFLHVFKPGSFLPMLSVYSNIPNVYSFEALTPCVLYKAPREELLTYLDQHPKLLAEFTKRMLVGVNGVLSRMQQLVFDTAYSRTVSLLLYFARGYGETGESGVVVALPFAHKDVAAWIGSTRETASLQMEKLKHMKLISYTRQQLVIPDIAKLEKEFGKKY